MTTQEWEKREMNSLIIMELLNIISEEFEESPQDDPSSLRLVNIAPRDDNFDAKKLSCTIYPNDPDSPGGWVSEDTEHWMQRKVPFGAPDKVNELGGGQGFVLRFTLKFDLFYQSDQMPKEDVTLAANIIMSRIHRAILDDHKNKRRLSGLRDDFGAYMLRSTRAIKKRELTMRGGSNAPFASGKLFLEFEVYYDQ